MEVASLSSFPSEVYLNPPVQSKASTDLYLLNAATGAESDDRVSAGVDDLTKSLSITAQEVLAKLNELLKNDLPDGIESLNPEEYTSEATADRIVKQVTAFFDLYAKQHPELQGEDLLSGFMAEIKKGVDQGYDQASATLQDLGAFEFDGVKNGVEETKRLIDEKLAQYEKSKRVDLGLDPSPVQSGAESAAKDGVLKQAGSLLQGVIA